MKILITGANGFIGQYLIKESLLQGHDVVAFIRSTGPRNWSELPNFKIITGDLLSSDNLVAVLQDCDAVIHLAANMNGDGKTQYLNSLQATRNLLKAMDVARVSCLIGVSSISVLDYIASAPMSMIDETTPVNRRDATMGAYALMKRDQEELLKEWSANGARKLAIVRPGIVYDDKNLSIAHVGFVRGHRGLAARHDGQVPVVYVKCVAQALVTIASADFQHEVIHLVNDDLPTQTEYFQALRKDETTKATMTGLVYVSWKTFTRISGFIRFVLSLIGKSSKVPDSFRENSVAGRQKPLAFGNRYAKDKFGWKPVKGIYTDSGNFS